MENKEGALIVEVGRLKDQIADLLDERQDLYAQIDKATPKGSDLRFEQEDDAVWVFSGDSHQGTEISHLITSHIDDYNEDDVRLICHYAANEIDRLRAKLAKAPPEGFVLVPIEPTKAIKTALSYQCFDFISPAQIYRDHGFDIPKKAEYEQSFFLHKLLILAIKHGDDFIKIFNAETKAMIEAQEQSHE